MAQGYENTTMLGIAQRSGASKETLYRWFGSKEGLFTALIKHQAETTITRVRTALEDNANPRDTLIGFAQGLLGVLLFEPSESLNRAAMTSEALAQVLLRYGRHATKPIVEGYLHSLSNQGDLKVASPETAFQVLYGPIIQDWQIRVLLGEQAPTREVLAHHAASAVDRFLSLWA